MFELRKIAFGPDQISIVLQTTICKANKKADILTTRTDNYIHSLESVNSHLYLENSFF